MNSNIYKNRKNSGLLSGFLGCKNSKTHFYPGMTWNSRKQGLQSGFLELYSFRRLKEYPGMTWNSRKQGLQSGFLGCKNSKTHFYPGMTGGIKVKQGFTLIELLVVIAIIALLSSVVIAYVGVSREKARMAAAIQFDSNQKHALGDRLIGQWTFDDSSKPLADSSGMGKNASCANCPTLVEGYNGNNAYLFDGVNDMLNIGLGSDYFPQKAFSACAWMKSPGLSAGMSRNGVVSITYGVTLNVVASGQILTYLDDGVAGSSVSGATKLHDDKFHHVCHAFDGVNRIIYADGKQIYKAPFNWQGTTRWPGIGAAIGADVNSAPTSYFNGVIDDVRIYAGAISEASVRKLYANSVDLYKNWK